MVKLMANDLESAPLPEAEAQGWDWFEEQARKEYQDQSGMDEQEIIAHFQKCFGTTSGKIVLAYLEKLTIETVDFDPTHGFYNGAAFGYYRSGQKFVFREIRKLINTNLSKLNRAKGKD